MKYERKKVEVNCAYCDSIVLKDESEVTRNLKLNRKNYCNNVCSGKVSAKNLIGFGDSSKLIPNNRKDEFTGFRDHLRRAKRRDYEANITLEDLKEAWDNQKGLCVYSKVQLINPNYVGKNDPIYTASLDRIDSSKGYIKGNIQFVSIAINHMKGSMNEIKLEELLGILKTL